jgi:hypothetical protein
MTINFSVAPYYDDFDSTKNYHKILFVPGRALQSRELTQIQSILQHQIKLNGDYMFKNGAMIVPGNVDLLNNVRYVKLESTIDGVSTDTIIDSFLDKKIVGATTDVKAVVIHVEKSTASEPPTLFINYISGGVVNNVFSTEFIRNEELCLEEDANTILKVLNLSTYTGLGSLANIKEGVYYINGFFVQNVAQVISLDKFGITPTYRIGLSFVENIITAFDDPTLNDTAVDSNNFGAPGADRYQVVLTLDKRSLFEDQENTNTTNDQFIDLLHVKDGQIQFKVNKTELSEFERTLARKTYDESGDYVVRPFKYEVHEYRNNNRGDWAPSTVYIEGDIIKKSVTVGITTKDQYFVALVNGVSSPTTFVPTNTYGEFDDSTMRWLATDKPVFNTGFHKSTSAETFDKQLLDSSLGLIKISEGTAFIKGFEVDVSGYRTVTFNKAREIKRVANSVIKCNTGAYILVNTVRGIPPLTHIDSSNKVLSKLTIKNAVGASVGTCRIRNVEYDSGTTTLDSCVYKCFIFDIVMDDGKLFYRDAKKIITASNTTFSANVVGTRVALSGSVTGSAGTINGDGTQFSLDLVVGDTIVISGVSYRVSAVTDSVTLTLDTATPTIATAVPVYLERTELVGAASLLQKLPTGFVRSLRGSDDSELSTEYYTKRVEQFVASGTTKAIPLTVTGETFAPNTTGNYFIALADGSAIPVVATVAGAGTSSITISGLTNAVTYRVMYTVKKISAAAKEKQKIRKIKTVDFTTVNSVSGEFMQLTEADCTRIISISQSGGTQFNYASPAATVSYDVSVLATDVTSNYRLDSGQTNTYYGLGKIYPLNGFKPSAPIRVTYEYFDHTQGDYFSVNSYNVPYNMLPVFNGVSAADYLDFRPRIDDNGTTFDAATGASVTEPLSEFYSLQTDYSYYLARRDILQLDPKGSFRVEEGIPADLPVAPLPNDDNVILAYVDLDPYTFTSNSSNVHITNNPMQRYTMKDIGAIDNRLKNVEYYTALNALEQQTSLLQIKDQFGLDRYKNGFIVDRFKDHGAGNVSNPNYRCAIDPGSLECRPSFYSDDVRLLEKEGQSRTTNSYQVTGDIATLPYSSVVLMEQKTATTPEYITPYTHVRSMIGDLKIFPASDTWVDTVTLPVINQVGNGNFAAVQVMAQSTGILGTVWNSWQATGRTTIASTLTNSVSRVGVGAQGAETSRTNVVSTNTLNGTDLLTFGRGGIETFVQEQIDEVGRVTSVVDESWSPFIRQKAIVLFAKRMLPINGFDVYVDNTTLTQYVVPASTLRLTDKVGTFLNYSTSNIDHSNLTSRQYGSNSYDILERGEVIRGATSGATAIVVCEETQVELGISELVLKVLNVKGTFVANEKIVGTTSGASATFTSVTTETNIRTNSAGSFYGILMLPNNSQVRITAGIVTISLRDNIDQKSAKTTSFAMYDGQGIIQTMQTTIMSIRNGVISRRNASETSQTTENWSTVVSSTVIATEVTNCNCACNCACDCGSDPLSQTFMHSDRGGIFLTSIDLYFYDVDQDESTGVSFEIREVVNGYPGPGVVPFSHVVKYPSELVASKTSLVPTKFTFDSPVYLPDNKEYCFVVASGISNTRLWIAKMGEVSLDGRSVVSQPSLGSMFRSQNNSTWDADQLSDMCFTLYKAKFNITTPGHVAFKNIPLGSTKLDNNPFKINASSTTVRVSHKNHGLYDGAIITFSGVVSALTHPTSVELNKDFTISDVELDSYTITIPVAATNSGWYGGAACMVTTGRRMDTMHVSGKDFVLPGTHINYTYRGTTRINNVVEKLAIDYPVQLNRNIEFDNPRYVLTPANETDTVNEDSFSFDAFLYSNNENLSPVVDLPTYSLHTISNKINNPTSAINKEIDSNLIFSVAGGHSGVIVFNNAGYFIISGGLYGSYVTELGGIKVGKYVKFTGTVSNNSPLLVTKVEKLSTPSYKIYTSSTVVTETAPTTAITLVRYDHYVDAISPDTASNLASYVSKIVELQKQSSGFKLMFDYNKPVDAHIDVYYKVNLKSAYGNIERQNWTKLSDATFVEGLTSVFREQSIDMETALYDQIMIKIVLNSDNTSKVPRIKNFRLISLA